MKEQDLIHLAFGKGTIPIRADARLADWRVIRPRPEPPLQDAGAAFQAACRHPIACPSLHELFRREDKVVVVTSDGTRPVPNRLLIPWLLRELPVPCENVTVLLGNGTHRSNTPEEIADMFGADVARSVMILNHDAFDHKTNPYAGRTAAGTPVWLDQRYLEADKRIVLGFIEPHFFAGFSGGAKAVVPGVAGIDTILHIHRPDLIADPRSDWGILEGNPIRSEIAEMAELCPPEFTVNVTLNSQKEITGFFCGHHEEAHRQGCRRVKEMAMAPVPYAFPIVVTSNSGYPLDQNLYQTVKGISAAARILEPGGTILIASECCDGIPTRGNFARLMEAGSCPEDVLQSIADLRQPILDQWEAQILAGLLTKARVKLFSTMDKDSVQSCKLTAVADLQAALEECTRSLGDRPEVAVLPDGPLTIPYVSCSEKRGARSEKPQCRERVCRGQTRLGTKSSVRTATCQ
ncbi:MAG: nickel-dependent lactate racemase [Chloroflexi bacterium]|nr:nickel-dependent lactate racemase [Chloroflexota bacterium]